MPAEALFRVHWTKGEQHGVIPVLAACPTSAAMKVRQQVPGCRITKTKLSRG